MTGNVHRRLSSFTGPLRLSLTRPQRALPSAPKLPPAPYTGPQTEAQLVALRNLQAIAIQQSSPVPDELH